MSIKSAIFQRLGLGGPRVISEVQKEALTYLEQAALEDLHELVAALEKNKAPGIMIECGCALGGSAIVMASAKAPERPFYIYDVFGMIPPPSNKDGKDVLDRYDVIKSGKAQGIAGHKYYGYENDLLDKVVANFTRYDLPPDKNNIYLMQGLFQDTLNVTQPVAIAHVDGDWYESVSVCVERIAPHLTPDGVMIIDDYDAWSGCQRAVDDFLKNRAGEFKIARKARPHIVRA